MQCGTTSRWLCLRDGIFAIYSERLQPFSLSEIPVFCSSVLRSWAQLGSRILQHYHLTSPSITIQHSWDRQVHGSAVMTYGCCVSLWGLLTSTVGYDTSKVPGFWVSRCLFKTDGKESWILHLGCAVHTDVAEELGWQFRVGKEDPERAECRFPEVVWVYGSIFGAKNVYGMCQSENIPGPGIHSFSVSLSNSPICIAGIIPLNTHGTCGRWIHWKMWGSQIVM